MRGAREALRADVFVDTGAREPERDTWDAF